MTGSEATFLAAIIAASVAGAGFIWSIVSFIIVRRGQRASDAREQWSRRFEQAHALALSTDPREARTGLMLVEGLARERWVTDEDKATAFSILTALSPSPGSPGDQARESILSNITDKAVAAELSRTKSGPKGRFELYTDKAGGFRWRLKLANGEVVATGPGYSTKAAALRAIDAMRKAVGGGPANNFETS